MEKHTPPDASFLLGKIIFSIPAPTFMSLLLLAVSPLMSGFDKIEICLAVFIFSGYEIILNSVNAIKRKRFLHPDIFVSLSVIGTFLLGFWQEGSWGIAVWSACRSIRNTELVDMERTMSFCPPFSDPRYKYKHHLTHMSSKASPIEKAIRKTGALYSVLCLIIILFLTMLVPALWQLNYRLWMRRACILLSAACPGVLGYVASTEYFKCLNLSALYGVLYRDRSAIQRAARVTSVVFSRNNTISSDLHIARLIPNGISENQLLSLAAYACAYSSEKYAATICRQAGTSVNTANITQHAEIPRTGSAVVVGNIKVGIGSPQLMHTLEIEFEELQTEAQVVYIACGSKYAGCIVFSESGENIQASAIKELKNNGIDRIILLSHESKGVVEPLAAEVGISEFFSDLSLDAAENKLENLRKMQIEGELLAYINDGFSSPTLMNKADVRISVGTEYAASTSDIVIPDNDYEKVAAALRLCESVEHNIRFNLITALVVKILIIAFSILGFGGIWLAVLLDTAACMIVIPGTSDSLVRIYKKRRKSIT